MKKGLWLHYSIYSLNDFCFRWNHWPDEKGIVTLQPIIFINFSATLESLTWWKRDCDIKAAFCPSILPKKVGIIDLMKKGLWLILPLRTIFLSPLESLTWWKRDCDYIPINIHSGNTMLESLTWWKRDCDFTKKSL